MERNRATSFQSPLFIDVAIHHDWLLLFLFLFFFFSIFFNDLNLYTIWIVIAKNLTLWFLQFTIVKSWMYNLKTDINIIFLRTLILVKDINIIFLRIFTLVNNKKDEQNDHIIKL